MTPIEEIALYTVFLLYFASQHVLNWLYRMERDKQPWETMFPLVLFGFVVTNFLFIAFIRYLILNIPGVIC